MWRCFDANMKFFARMSKMTTGVTAKWRPLKTTTRKKGGEQMRGSEFNRLPHPTEFITLQKR